MEKKIFCKTCDSEIGKISDGKILFESMRLLSKVEIDLNAKTSNIKCHSCHNWNEITESLEIKQNHKRKAQEHLKI